MIRNNYLAVLLGAVVVAVLWESASRVSGNPRLIPSLGIVATESVASFSQFDRDGDPSWFQGGAVILEHTLVTFLRIFIGGNLGALAGVFVGLMLYYVGWLRTVGQSAMTVFRAVPLLCLIPLFVYWFGGSELGIHLWIFFACFVVMVTNATDAILNVPPNITNLARLLGAPRHRLFVDIMLPAITPQLLTAYRATMGLAWMFALGGEYLVARSGLGYLASSSYMYSDMGKLLTLTLYYGLLGVCTHYVTGFLPALLCPWVEPEPSRTSSEGRLSKVAA